MTIPLSPAQRKYLWLRATGLDEQAAQEAMGATNTYMISKRMQQKLGADTLPHAVYIACQTDLIGPREHCGTMDGIRDHQGRGEDLCRACLRLNIEYTEAENKGRYDTAPVLTDAERRLLDFLDSELTTEQIIVKWGRTRAAVMHVRRRLYRKLGVADIVFPLRRAKAVEAAARYGLIITKDTPPDVLERLTRRAEVPKLTDLEVRTLAVLADGTSLTKAAPILGVPASTYITSRLGNIYRKLDVAHLPRGEKRAAAVARARDLGYDV